MTEREAIERRVSRRKYTDKAVDAALRREFEALAASYGEAGGVRIEIAWDEAEAFRGFRRSYGLFSGVRNYIGLIDRPGEAGDLEKLGYYGEKLVLEATKRGLATCWVGGSFSRAHCPFRLAANERIACAIALGYASESPGGMEKLVRNVTHRKSKTFEQMASWDDGAPDWFFEGVKAVERAPSAVMRQPVAFAYRQGAASASVPDPNDVGMALDFGIAKLHFEIGAGGGVWNWGNGAAFAKNDEE